MRERNRKLSFWVSETEQKKIKRLVGKSGLRDGEFLRTSALGKPTYRVEELKPMLHELKAIGRNLNQLTVLAHEGRIRTVGLREVLNTLERNYSAIDRLFAGTDYVIVTQAEEAHGDL